MRITFILPFVSLNGGIRVVAAYARELLAMGHHVTVVSQPHVPNVTLKARVKRLLGRQTRPRHRKRTTLLDFLGDEHVVLREARPVIATDLPDADVVIATWWETAEWVAELPPEKGRKVYLIQGYEVYPPNPPERVVATYHLDFRKIAVSGYIRSQVEGVHNLGPVAVAPNAVDTNHFRSPDRAKAGRPTLGFLYTLVAVKRVALALEAVNAARARCPDLQLLMFGAGDRRVDLPIPEWTTYHKSLPQSEIPSLYSACDAWLLTSEKEGFGLPILEAMVVRHPFISTRAGAAADLIDGTNGLLVDGDLEAIRDGILHFVQMDPEAWLTHSKAAPTRTDRR